MPGGADWILLEPMSSPIDTPVTTPEAQPTPGFSALFIMFMSNSFNRSRCET